MGRDGHVSVTNECFLHFSSVKSSGFIYFNFIFSPITYAWEGGKLISENDDFEDMVVTREDYEENGHSVCEEKFDI